MSETRKLGKFKIFRFDPTVDKEPRYQVYEAPIENFSVMNVLQYISENIDRSISYRCGCLGKSDGLCGACPILVNGTPVLSCQKLAEESMVLEPHPKFEILKDLVVDLNHTRPNNSAPQQKVEITVDESKCLGCNDCVFICPVGVYELRKVNGKRKAFPTDSGSCCGTTCELCVRWCWTGAISIKTKKV